MRICLLMVLAFAASASADTGVMRMECAKGQVLFHTFFESSCLKIMPKAELFEDAYKACQEDHARMLSFSHRMDKVYFVNKMIMDNKAPGEESSLWFFDPDFMHDDLAKEKKKEEGKDHMAPNPNMWMVISPNPDNRKIEIQSNSSAVPRKFICESPAHPAAQRPQFLLEPEHLFIADIMVQSITTVPKEQPKPFIVTFNCQAYGLPKPTVEWRTIYKADNQSLMSEAINAKVITDPKEPLKEPSMTGVTFFNLQRDCKAKKCPPDSIQERSQLVVVNPQFMDLRKSIVCLAKNDFGSVLSREAQIFVTKMGEFASKEDKTTVKAGISAVISNAITTVPDAAAAECYRINKPANAPADAPPAQMIPIEELNQMLQGAIQMSKSTFDLIIDSAAQADAGDFVCRARLHNGRMGHVIREKTISLKVEPCVKADGCDLEAKPVTVVKGYPAVLSMNPLDNHVIRAGDDFLLECPCTGKRRPDELLTVNWNLRNRTDLPAMLIPMLPQGSALLLTKADQQTHSGMYHCQCVRGQEKSDWRAVNVQVLPSTEPMNHQEILTAKAGDKATFSCHVGAEFPGLGVFVEPLRGDIALADFLAQSGNSRLEIVRDGPSHANVVFNDIKETDAGVYGCRVTVNYFGKWVEHDTFYTTLIVKM